MKRSLLDSGVILLTAVTILGVVAPVQAAEKSDFSGLPRLSAIPAPIGEKQTIDFKQEQVPLAEPWEFKLATPIWVAGVWGETGVRGKTSDVDVDPDVILRKLNFTASFSAEARKGPFGAFADFLYLSDQAGAFRSGLVSKVDLRVDQYLAEFDLSWRVINTPRGWLDVLAGFRYTNVYSRVGLQAKQDAIESASEEFVDVASGRIQDLLEKALRGALDLNNPTLPVPPLAADQQEKLLEFIQAAKEDPELAAAIKSGVQARIERAKIRVQNEIARRLNKTLNRSYSLGEDWFDPYIGLRARYNLSKVFYLTAKADVGGFGVGSQVTCQAYGAVGCQLTRFIYSEAGYRYLYDDYRNNGFIYNLSTGGAQLTLGINF